MGEAKRRVGREHDAFETVERHLRDLAINTSDFGFYDSEQFLRAEKRDPELLEQYAQWVLSRPRDAAYEAHVRDVVPRLTSLLSTALYEDRMLGGCVAAAGMMTRMLDRLGVWSFAVHGCLTLQVGSRNLWRGFATCDDVDFEGGMPGHSWVVAPPYRIVDPSLVLQHLDGDPIKPFVPPTLVCETDCKTVSPDVTDVVANNVGERYLAKEGQYDPLLHYRLQPRLRQIGRIFPALESVREGLKLRYVPIAIRMTDVPLELINVQGKVGRPANDTWYETIAPAFGIAP